MTGCGQRSQFCRTIWPRSQPYQEIGEGVGTGCRGHEQKRESVQLPVLEIAEERAASQLVWEGITTILVDTCDDPSLLVVVQESRFVREIDYKEERADSKGNRAVKCSSSKQYFTSTLPTYITPKSKLKTRNQHKFRFACGGPAHKIHCQPSRPAFPDSVLIP